MILFPNCKLNLGLRIAEKRADGYHNLETIFYPLPLRDAAEITVCPGKKEHNEPFELTVTGVNVPGQPSANLCTKAWQLIRNDFPGIPPVRMHLHKAIPVGAGLGGGSSDGAFTLMLLNEELKLNLSTEQLLHYALMLGSDCPFFILNTPCYATGRGEIMEEISIDLGDHYFILVEPGIHVKTGEVFNDLADMRNERKQTVKNSSDQEFSSFKEIIRQPVKSWRETLFNEFEESVFMKFPALKEIKEILYDNGAEYASMTGTGSSIYGIFPGSKKAGNLRLSEKFKVYLLNQFH